MVVKPFTVSPRTGPSEPLSVPKEKETIEAEEAVIPTIGVLLGKQRYSWFETFKHIQKPNHETVNVLT